MFNPDLNQKPINIMPKSVIFLIFLVAFVEFVLQLGQKGHLVASKNISRSDKMTRINRFFGGASQGSI